MYFPWLSVFRGNDGCSRPCHVLSRPVTSVNRINHIVHLQPFVCGSASPPFFFWTDRGVTKHCLMLASFCCCPALALVLASLALQHNQGNSIPAPLLPLKRHASQGKRLCTLKLKRHVYNPVYSFFFYLFCQIQLSNCRTTLNNRCFAKYCLTDGAKSTSPFAQTAENTGVIDHLANTVPSSRLKPWTCATNRVKSIGC